MESHTGYTSFRTSIEVNIMNAKVHHKYNEDFYAWAVHSAELIRQGKFSEVDTENVAEELESMGRSDKRKLLNRLALLMAHLLKWQFQPARRSNSWKYTIKEQRLKLRDLLEESPSLRHELELKLSHAYEQSVLIAVRQTGLDEASFPKQCPYNLAQCFDEFLPE
jgi:Domain of unknown function DUF29